MCVLEIKIIIFIPTHVDGPLTEMYLGHNSLLKPIYQDT